VTLRQKEIAGIMSAVSSPQESSESGSSETVGSGVEWCGSHGIGSSDRCRPALD
jgi:hypothetical protein